MEYNCNNVTFLCEDAEILQNVVPNDYVNDSGTDYLVIAKTLTMYDGEPNKQVVLSDGIKYVHCSFPEGMAINRGQLHSCKLCQMFW